MEPFIFKASFSLFSSFFLFFSSSISVKFSASARLSTAMAKKTLRRMSEERQGIPHNSKTRLTLCQSESTRKINIVFATCCRLFALKRLTKGGGRAPQDPPSSGGGRERGIFHPVLNSRGGGGCYLRAVFSFPISFMVTSNGEKGFALPPITRPVVLECKEQRSVPTQTFFQFCM